MSWFRRSPHRYETEKKLPRRPEHLDSLKNEIEENRQRLSEHRNQAEKKAKDGKLH
jgi:hypothetical protein